MSHFLFIYLSICISQKGLNEKEEEAEEKEERKEKALKIVYPF